MDILRTLWYIRKVRVYDALIIKMTKLRAKLRDKQSKYTERSEHYRKLVNERNKV